MFIMCWSPYIVFDLLQVFGHLPRTQTMIAVATFIQSLAPLNSAANPIIYIIFSNNVCRNLRWVRRSVIVVVSGVNGDDLKGGIHPDLS